MTDESAAAADLDRAIDDALAGRPPDPVLEGLVAAHAAEPPPALRSRVATKVRRTLLPLRLAAAALGALFVLQGLGNFVSGRWVARNLEIEFEGHLFFEGGVLLVALGTVLLAAALERRWLPPAVAAGAPAGLVFGINGAGELGEFPAGGILHLSQGIAAMALLALWLQSRRYGTPRSAKRGHGS